ncbi:hypothetical protein [Leptospira yanagawae]|uniref:hypothetical protein n=1 Tax=Leptospira yanagawae TaxID=293069 RepID=UPI001FC9A0ED|nr:hypothetical protein [Leptospira yanagawae]
MRILNGRIYLQKLLIKLSKCSLILLLSCSGLQPSLQFVTKGKITEREQRFKSLVETTWIQFSKIGLFCEKEVSYHKLFCKIQTVISLHKLSEYFGIKIFISGPHSKYYLERNDQFDFGHYNPEFPKKLKEYLLPAKQNPKLLQITKPIYEEWIKQTARDFFIIYQKLDSNSNFFRKEADRYLMLVEEGRLDPFYFDRFILFLYPAFTDNEDPEEASKFKVFVGDEVMDAQIVKELVGFWIRRKADGTDLEFISGLVELLNLYDPEFLEFRTNGK